MDHKRDDRALAWERGGDVLRGPFLLVALALAAPGALGADPLAPEIIWEATFAAGELVRDTFVLAKAYDWVEVRGGCALFAALGPDARLAEVRACGATPHDTAVWEAGAYDVVATRLPPPYVEPATLRIRGVDHAALEARRVDVVSLDVPAGSSRAYVEDPLGPGHGTYVRTTIDCRGGAATVSWWDGDHPLPFTVPMGGIDACANEVKRVRLVSPGIEIDNDDFRVVVEAHGPPGFVAHYRVRAIPP